MSSRQRGVAKGTGASYRLRGIRSRVCGQLETAFAHSPLIFLTSRGDRSAAWHPTPARSTKRLLALPAPDRDAPIRAATNRRLARDGDPSDRERRQRRPRPRPHQGPTGLSGACGPRPGPCRYTCHRTARDSGCSRIPLTRHPQPLVAPQVRQVRHVPARTTSAEPQLQQTSPEWFEAIIRWNDSFSGGR
jgi:hypothetical protein